MYPRVEISLDKIRHNAKKLISLCNNNGINVAAVTKVFCGMPEIAKVLVESGASVLADSRIENLKRLQSIEVPKLLLRLPMISQADEVVQFADISLNSELETIRVLSQKAVDRSKIHSIILMIDLGDLREGILDEEETLKTVAEILRLKGIKLLGLGTNLTCYAGVIPKHENLNHLVNIKEKIEKEFSIKLEIVSGGNSSSLYLLDGGEGVPKGINQLRLGESIVLGRETAFGNIMEDTYEDCFRLVTEIIEIKDKPSLPIGEIGMDAFGNKPVFQDKGIRKRAICAIGKQDVSIDNIVPEDEKITIFGGSSDHLIIDVTDSLKNYKVGDKVSFKLSYGGILSTSTSEYVAKVFI
ncbi:alanine racemase domain-containing protein [Proteiniborus sp. DW1]|uniref:ornithine racemase Orr n=1 Tax=Proteiniborus sp. DW1 TaxID=1889883 RepID=UPI00092DEFE3|nr:ornithine racemase Orr [Proteiniborus sp. DW1]SCG83230.1 alanine racemase domain-containing protein [Proteiniborus sp. DW1]